MKSISKIITGYISDTTLIVLTAASFIIGLYGRPGLNCAQAAQQSSVSDAPSVAPVNTEVVFVGPRQNVPADAPSEYGFWSFAVPVPGVLSRSGQPTIGEFRWLKDHGYRSIVDLRLESGPTGNDNKIPGFNELYFNYLALPIQDGSVPTEAQAWEFLEFVTNPLNQPALLHCHAGVGRTGLMTALYRYTVQGWPMDKAIGESRLFGGGVNGIQKNWLEIWVNNHKPGQYKFAAPGAKANK